MKQEPKRVLVVGAGKQGVAIAYGLFKLGIKFTLVDVNESILTDAINKLSSLAISWSAADYNYLIVDTNPPLVKHFSCYNLVISSAPYFVNEGWAELALKNHVPYIDLGGNVAIQEKIELMANLYETPCFASFGLAPGVVSLIAENLYHKLSDIEKVISINMYVGGLPVYPPDNALQYCQVFSLDGLINEYRDDCKILFNNKETIVPGMSSLEVIDGTFEAFNTSGGLSHTLKLMQDRGVSFCSYKTLRYHGHHRAIKDILFNCPESTVKELLNVLCPPTTADFVTMKVLCRGEHHELNYHNNWNSSKDFTAMQQMTAFPVAAIASLILETNFEKDYDAPKYVLDYSDVPFDTFSKKLEKLGVKL